MRIRKGWAVIVLPAAMVLLVVILAACSSGDKGASNGGSVDGQVLFQETLVNQSPGCVTCHSLEPDVRLVGPSMAGVATRAESIVDSPAYNGNAQSAQAFLREAIVDPDAYVPEGYISGTMYQRYETALSSEQIDALVDYMLTLK